MREIITVVSVTISLFMFIFGLVYLASCKEASVVNKLFDKNYTCSEFFWSGDTIKQSIIGHKVNFSE